MALNSGRSIHWLEVLHLSTEKRNKLGACTVSRDPVITTSSLKPFYSFFLIPQITSEEEYTAGNAEVVQDNLEEQHGRATLTFLAKKTRKTKRKQTRIRRNPSKSQALKLSAASSYHAEVIKALERVARQTRKRGTCFEKVRLTSRNAKENARGPDQISKSSRCPTYRLRVSF